MRERQRERNGNGEARRAGDRVVGPTKLPGSTTDTFRGSNHQDTMTTRSLASSPTRRPSTVGLITVLLLVAVAQICSGAYYGKLIGKLSELHHGVSGEVYAVDARTLFIKDFTYDGEGPAAFFYAGSSKSPGNNGFRVRDERGTTNVLKRYRKKDITLTLPDGKTLNNIKWFSIWCDEFSVNFGDVRIPRGFDYPKPQKLKTLNGIHGVSSEPVVIVDAQTLLIPSFSYDGEAPDAKFWVGAGQTPSPQGIRVPDENGKEQPLRRYDRKTIVLTLPADLTVHQLGHFGVWCEAFAVDFGHVQIPHNLNIPPSLKMLGVSPQNVHRGGQGQSGALTSAYEISSFASSSPSPLAIFPSFASSLSQQHQRPTTYRPLLRRDDQFQIVQAVDPLIPTQAEELRQAQSPAYASAADAADYQEQFYRTADVASASPTSSPYHPHPSPRSRTRLAEPQQNSYARLLHFQGDRRIDSFSKLNCEVLEDSLAFEVRWAVAGDSIVIQLVAKLDAGQYMSFGLSADTEKSAMVGGDVTVAWVDKQTLQGYAIDYFLDAKSQCSGRRGSCPDRRIQENTDSVRLLNAAMVNGYSIVTYQRPLKASDELDQKILTNGSQAIIWAIGPLNDRQEVSFHSHYLKTDRFIEFGRPPAWNCPMPDQEPSHGDANETASSSQLVIRRQQRVSATPAPAPTTDAWEIPPIQCNEPDDGVFYAQMGPTGGKHGYPAITGHVGWGISWYINGLLIPVINVVRGRRYTFVVEGGLDPDIPARYHPFYITDDLIGGYYHKTAEEKAKVKIFAGVRRQRGKVTPTGVGRLCNWVPDQNQPPADDFASFGAYQRTLTLECDHGEPGIVEWTPDENTPDTVYYQCFTHRYLGWKINVLDRCDVSEASPAASEKHEVYAEPGQNHQDLEYGASISVPSKVTPTAEFLHQQHAHHSHREYGHRYPHHHSTTNSKLSVSHPQLLTNANNNYDRLQSSSSSETSYEVHPRDAHRVDEEILPQQKQQKSQQHRSATIVHESPSSLHAGTHLTELAREIQHTATNQELSNLVADHQRPSLSHGTRLPYVTAAISNTQLPFSRAPHHYASNYHHYVRHQLPSPPSRYYHQLEPPRTQLMIIRRPMTLTRHPMLQTLQQAANMITTGALSLPFPFSFGSSSSPRPILIERKKSIYRPPIAIATLKTTPRTMADMASLSEKLTAKIDTKQRTKFEAKVGSDSDFTENHLGPPWKLLKPARNTGFDPDSIVIESGFKPIIRNVFDKAPDVAQKRLSGMWQDGPLRKNGDYRTIDEFSPVFVPSLPVTSSTIDGGRKRRKKISSTRSPPRFDDIDDMEMAADLRLDTYYLPPIGRTRSEELPSPSSSGVLITYDGKKLRDPTGLARSISDAEHYTKGRLTSDILSRTPQFGKFQGELPPLIPGEMRANGSNPLSSYGKKNRLAAVDLSPRQQLPKTSTRLKLVERSKRSPLDVGRTMSSVDFQHEHRERDRIETVNGGTHLGDLGWVVLIAIARLAI
ncbi:PREDICTED: protein Skeletor, isoforms D/E-like isoform X1 [Cyphomyrmex costatus]|uniref:protein Skeletor, isoforms D/E-like isoform X1 n=1 Tax=Cyphomyrmex costatus TaxID=456900 RepID=UPI000852413E|nr:PREDICTED: protein Skeletor, isoforms D/E-like isoform X1 [Cyphomyrmex costatus]